MSRFDWNDDNRTGDYNRSVKVKDLNRHLECTEVSFNPENGAFVIHRLTDRQSDYCNHLTEGKAEAAE